MSGILYLVATPIGNLEDITLRALRILGEVECVLAEDTRHSRTLLAHHGIHARLESLHAHTNPARIEHLAGALAEGARFALITDAGCPLVSDPGGVLVEAAISRGVRIEAIPGPSAVLTALSVAGMGSDQFRFAGFLPRSGKRRREALARLAGDRSPTVLFEAPRRLAATLVDLREACGGARRASVCRELTKLHEEVARGSLDELCAKFPDDVRGEVTIVVSARVEAELADEGPSPEEVDARIDEALALGVRTKELANALASEFSLDPRETYRRVVSRKASTSSH